MAEPTVQVENGILHDVKQNLGLEWDDLTFDLDIRTHINSVFLDLQQIGVGPEDGFEVTGPSETWADFLGTAKYLNAAKSVVYIRVRMIFDPPSTGPLATSLEKQADRLEYRLMMQVDYVKHPLSTGVINE